MENAEWNRKFEILTQIEELEAKQGRVMREAVLGDSAAIERLARLEESIEAKRQEMRNI